MKKNRNHQPQTQTLLPCYENECDHTISFFFNLDLRLRSMHFVTLPWWSLNWCMSETQFKVIVDAHWSGSNISKSLPSPMFIKIQLSLRPNQRAKLRSSKKLSHQRLPVDKVADRHTHCCSSIAVWFWFSAHSPSHIIKHSDNSQIQIYIYIYDTNICVNNSAPHSPFSGIIIVIVLPLTLRLTYIFQENPDFDRFRNKELRNSSRFNCALAAALQLASGDREIGVQLLQDQHLVVRNLWTLSLVYSQSSKSIVTHYYSALILSEC